MLSKPTKYSGNYHLQKRPPHNSEAVGKFLQRPKVLPVRSIIPSSNTCLYIVVKKVLLKFDSIFALCSLQNTLCQIITCIYNQIFTLVITCGSKYSGFSIDSLLQQFVYELHFLVVCCNLEHYFFVVMLTTAKVKSYKDLVHCLDLVYLFWQRTKSIKSNITVLFHELC